jgi:uncharacterized protein YndB with AHSA1/START domain
MTGSTDRIEKQIFLKATRARVWRALANAEEFGNWFGVALQGQTFAPGREACGQYTIPGCERLAFEIKVERMEPERLLSFYWHPCSGDPATDYSGETPTHVVFELRDAPGGILLHVVESGFDKLPASRRAVALKSNTGGWEHQLKNIEHHVTAS